MNTTRTATTVQMNRNRLIACLLSVAVLAGVAGTAPALAAPSTTTRHEAPGVTLAGSGARVYTQSSHQTSIPVPGGPNQFVPVDSSPVLPVGNYAYTMVVDIFNVPPGSQVLCGQQVRPFAGSTSGDYGIVDNTGGSAVEAGHCVLSGVATVNQPNSTMSFWTTDYSGPTGAIVGGWSMTETKVGTVTFSP